MRFVSPVTLGLILALGGVSMGVAAPSALAKDKQEAGAQPKVSPGFQPAAVKLDAALKKKDAEGAKALVPEARAAVKTNDDKYFFNSLMLSLSTLVNDGAMQNDALKGMLESGFVPLAQQGIFNNVLANNAIKTQDYDAAIAYAQKAIDVGYKPEEANAVMAQAVLGKAGKNPAEVSRGLGFLKKAIEAQKAAGKPVPGQWYQYATVKAAEANLPELGEWASMGFAADPSGENLRTVLRVLQRTNPTMTNRENLDLLRLMSFSGGLAIRPDYQEYAEMAFKAGIYGEVKSIIDKGRAARDQDGRPVLNTTDSADTYNLANGKIASDKAALTAASADAARAATGKIAAATADAYMGYGDNAKAVSLYGLALQKGGIDAAEVNMRLGIAQARAGNVPAAKEAFAKVNGGLRGALAQYWIKWLDGGKPAA